MTCRPLTKEEADELREKYWPKEPRVTEMNWQPIDTAPTRKEVIVYHKIAAKYGGTPWLVAWKDEKGAWHDDYQDDGFLVGAEHLTHWHDLTDPR